MVVVVVEEENNCLLTPTLSIVCSEGNMDGLYVVLISTYNVGQHGAAGYCKFLDI